MNTETLEEILSDIPTISLEIHTPNQAIGENGTDNISIHQILKDEQASNYVDINSILVTYGTSEEEVINAARGSDYKVSRLIALLLENHFCKNLSTQEWKKFNGVIWENDLKNERIEYVEKIVQNKVVSLVFRKSFHDNAKNPTTSKLGRLKKRLSCVRPVETLCELACTGTDGLGVLGEVFDSQLRYVGAPNGVIDLETGDLLPGNASHYITKTLGFPYNPLANEPEKFLEFLTDIFQVMTSPPEAPELPLMPDEPETYDFIDETEQERRTKWENECATIKAAYDQAHDNYQKELVQYEKKSSQVTLEVISFIQRLFGYILTGTGREHVFIVLHGAEGRNGKGVLVRTLMAVLGDYGGEVRSELLVRTGLRSSSSPTPDILDLIGKRFVVASETNQGEFFDTGGVKRLTGGDTLVGRALYGKYEVRFRPSHTIGLQTNFPPHAPTEDKAFWARLIMLKFNRIFVETPDPNNRLHAKINKKLESELLEEGESILKWLIDGVLHYEKEGLNPPECITSAKDGHKERTDLFGDFFDECCVESPNNRIQCADFTRVFNKWSTENGHKSMGRQTIIERLERRGIKKIKSNTWFYDNLEWSFEGESIKSRALRKDGEQF